MSGLTRGRKKFTIVAVAIAIGFAVLSAVASAAEHRAKVSRVSSQELQIRINQLEQQNQALETQNHSIQDQLNAQRQQIDVLMHQMQQTSQPLTAIQQQMPAMQAELSDVKKRQTSVPLEVGFRTGWSESPYRMPGGFYYGAFLNHRLLTHEDGIPGGFIAGEMLVGWTQGNHAYTNANLLSQLGNPPFNTWLYTLSLQPTVQYHLDMALLGLASLEAFRPYALAGPSMYINLLSTPVVVKNGNPGANYRHYDADVQGGGVFGAGFELGLSALKLPPIQGILDKSFVGAEYRYNQYGNGQGYNQYTGSVGFGW